MRTIVEWCGIVALAAGCGSEADNGGLFGSMGSDGLPSAGDGSGPFETGSGSDAGSSADGEGTGLKLDTQAGDGGGGQCNCGNSDWSYVFIANSSQSTVAKINTRTLVEEGRYLTRPDGAGNPSRTSVSVDGKAVAIANRHTGLLKLWSRDEFCDPNANATPGLQTSSGKDDVLAWGSEDCVAWYTPFAGMTNQRPVQWTSGQLNPGNCEYEDQKIWTVTGDGGNGPGQCGPQGVWVHRVDGDTGVVEETLHLPEDAFNCDQTNTGQGIGLGAYGGAVDTDGNFWFFGFGNNKLVRVDFDTLDYEVVSGGGYGITVDTSGRVWFGSLSRYDHSTQTWAYNSFGDSGGVAQDLQGRMWASAGNEGVRWADVDTTTPGDLVPLPGSSTVKGVSVDIDGYVWAVRWQDTRAFKIDPDTYDIEVYDGLIDPYTYSDMTGGQISNVTCNPAG